MVSEDGDLEPKLELAAPSADSELKQPSELAPSAAKAVASSDTGSSSREAKEPSGELGAASSTSQSDAPREVDTEVAPAPAVSADPNTGADVPESVPKSHPVRERLLVVICRWMNRKSPVTPATTPTEAIFFTHPVRAPLVAVRAAPGMSP
jgi:hypothetical protein